MDNKKLFEAALSAKMSDYPFSDTKTVMNNIMERAEKMKNHENAKQMKFTEITPEYIEPKKSHKAISVVAGIAGTAAVLTGAVFGLNWLSEHGGLKEGGIESSNGAGYHDTSETAGALQTDVPCTMPAKEGEEFVAPTSNTVDPKTLPDISELYGKPVQFHDATVWLNRAEYDGETFTARFSLLYTGDNYETYSPEYVKLTVGTPIDYTTEKFSIEEVPEADGYTHRCTYSVPVKLETGKSYAMGIEYLNTGGSSTQPIEADRQHYKYVYKPMLNFWLDHEDDNTYEFDKCTVTVTEHTFDGATLDMKYVVKFKDMSIADEVDFGLMITTTQACVVDSEILEKSEKGAYVRRRVMLMTFNHDCGVTFNENGTEYTYKASLPDNVNYLQSEIGSPEDNRKGIYPAFLNVLPSAVCVTYYGGDENTFITPEELTVYSDDGAAINGEYLTQIYNPSDYKICTNIVRYNIPTCDPAHIMSIQLGNDCIYERHAEKYLLDDLRGLDIDDAKEMLEKAHINYSITRHVSDDVPENCVIGTVPQAGAEINSSVIVNVRISSSVPSAFDDFAAAGEVYGHDFIDFGVDAKVHSANVFGFDIIQASKFTENVQFNEDGTISGEVPTAIGSPNETNDSIIPELAIQTVILASTPEERLKGFVLMNGFYPEKLEHSSYFSENLGLTVDVYYGKEGNVSNGFGTEKITSLAFIDDGDALYILSFENAYCLADVETAARKVTDYDQRNGYYEGEEALNILKQYAGEDYCFPLENWTKDVITYRTHDEWTGSDTSTDYRFNIPAEEGEPTLAVTGGTVIETNSRNVPGQGEGIYITIQAEDGRKWRYSHLSDYYVSEGDTVKAGDKIAAVGATGWCTGPLVCISFPDSEVIDPVAVEGGIVGIAQNIE